MPPELKAKRTINTRIFKLMILDSVMEMPLTSMMLSLLFLRKLTLRKHQLTSRLSKTKTVKLSQMLIKKMLKKVCDLNKLKMQLKIIQPQLNKNLKGLISIWVG